jgi:hypothetical protein
MTQTEIVTNHLTTYGSISPLEAPPRAIAVAKCDASKRGMSLLGHPRTRLKKPPITLAIDAGPKRRKTAPNLNFSINKTFYYVKAYFHFFLPDDLPRAVTLHPAVIF